MGFLRRGTERYFSASWPANMVTLANLFSGFGAILLAMEGRLAAAAWLILLCLVWDSLDGNAARRLHVSTPFGRELDSLADLVSFVVAPALLAFKICPPLQASSGFLYLAAGTYRLARFNVRPATRTYFEGLPTPAAAVTLASVVLAFSRHDTLELLRSVSLLAALMVGLSVLMVSYLRYPKLSAIKFSRWQWLYVGAFLMFLAAVWRVDFETGLVCVCLLFVALGPASAARNRFFVVPAKEDWLEEPEAVPGVAGAHRE